MAKKKANQKKQTTIKIEVDKFLFESTMEELKERRAEVERLAIQLHNSRINEHIASNKIKQKTKDWESQIDTNRELKRDFAKISDRIELFCRMKWPGFQLGPNANNETEPGNETAIFLNELDKVALKHGEQIGY